MWVNQGIRGDDEKLAIDFKHEGRFIFELDRSLMKQFMRGVAIKIWHKYPVKIFKPQVDEKKEPEFDIQVKEEMLGFCVLSLKPFGNDYKLMELNQKLPVYEYGASLLNHYNIYWPHPEEVANAGKHQADIEKLKTEKYAKKPEEELEKAKDGKQAPKKPDQKKKKPAAPAGGQAKKGAPVEEEVKVTIPAYPVNERKVIQYAEDQIAREGINNYKSLKWLVSGSILLATSVKLY